MTKKNRLTVRITPYQKQCLDEIISSMNTSYSLLIRAIIGDWLAQHEDQLERIICKKEESDADNKPTAEKEQDIFG